MRLIGTITQEENAQRFSGYLLQKGIENRSEAGQIWVSDEDRLAEAAEELKRFLENPADPRYNTLALPPKPAEDEEEEGEEPLLKPKQRLKAPVTMFFLALCVFLYMLNFMQEMQLSKEEKESKGLVLTPVQEALLFEVPPTSPETPYWQGLYDLVSLKLKGESAEEAEGPLFVQIREGEIWRFFTPCILHLNFLHILFNMIWLWMLGRPIEARIGSWRLLIFTVVVGVLTNTAQYLMSGPLFLGFSGIVMGWAGLIWMREKVAPWEGYPLQRATILFLAIFIFGMLGIQIVSFILTVFTPISFPVSIANTAHIAGLILGALFGRTQWLARRVR